MNMNMNMNKTLPKGFWPVMLTPFNEDGSINYNEYEKLIDFYIDNGAAGLFASCGSSEMSELSEDELFELAAKAVSYAADRVPVVAGAIIVDTLANQIGFVKKMHNSGADAVVISMSQFGEPYEDEDLIISRIMTVLEKTNGITLGLYECPYPYRRNFSPEKFAALIDTGRFVFHKDTCCNASEIRDKLQLIENSRLIFLNAHLPTLAASLEYGGDGYCGVAGNFFPDLISYVCDYFFETGIIDQKIIEFILSADDVIKEKYPRSAKIFLKTITGILGSHCRVDVPREKAEDIAAIERLAEDYRKFKETINTAPINSSNSKYELIEV